MSRLAIGRHLALSASPQQPCQLSFVQITTNQFSQLPTLLHSPNNNIDMPLYISSSIHCRRQIPAISRTCRTQWYRASPLTCNLGVGHDRNVILIGNMERTLKRNSVLTENTWSCAPSNAVEYSFTLSVSDRCVSSKLNISITTRSWSDTSLRSSAASVSSPPSTSCTGPD